MTTPAQTTEISTPLPPHEPRVSAVAMPTKEPSAGDWVQLAMFNESLINTEWKLAGDRATLMVTTQAFLFGAFFLILFNTDPKRAVTAKLLLNYIPFIGATVIAFASSGIFAAVGVACRLEHERSFYQGVLSRMFGIKMPDLGSRRDGSWFFRWSRVFGTAPFVIITSFLFLFWVIAALSRIISFGFTIKVLE
jgi:hypothetical protein